MITPNTPSTSHQENAVRRSGAALGIVVFLIGIALIGFVFVQAKALFAQPLPQLPVATPTPAAIASPTASPSPTATAAASPEATAAATAIGQIAMDFGKQVLFLLLMCIAGSVIASRGVEMFFKACAAAPPVVRPNAPPASPPADSTNSSRTL